MKPPHQCPLRLPIFDPFPDLHAIWDRAHGEDSWKVDTRHDGTDGSCTRGEHQRVIGFLSLRATVEIADHHASRVAVDRRHFVAGSYLDVEALPKELS
jgi:hypothetical protein